MRKIDESRAANYIRKHSNYKKWLAFVLCLSLLTGTVTLYILNKPATAMTEEGADSLGVILDTLDSEGEAELIQDTLENKLAAEGEGSGEGGDGNLFDLGQGDGNNGEDGDDAAGGEGQDGDDAANLGDTEETKDGQKSDDTALTEDKAAAEATSDEENKEETTEEDELTQDVVFTVSYVDENGESIADDKELSIEESFDPSNEAPSIDGYTFKEATVNGDVITKVAVKKNADDIRYYEVTFDNDETKEIKKNATVILTYTAEETKGLVITASYVDEEGKEIADEKELEISESFDPKKDSDVIEGYKFKEAKVDEDVVVLISAKEDEESGEKFYEATLEDKSTVEIKEDTTVVLSYATVDTAVVLTAKFVDKNGEEIQESRELNIGDETELKKNQITEVEGYFFNKAIYEDKEIVKIAPIFEEEKKDTDKDETETETETEVEESVEETATVKTIGYKFTTIDGEENEIKEDAEIEFSYLKASTETEFIFEDSKVSVKATVNGKNVFPEGIELKASEVTSSSAGYNYDAYMNALNENSDAIAKDAGQENATEFTENNTLLYDIAFMFEEKELQPAEGSVSISVEFKNNQLSSDLEAKKDEDITVIHLPIKDEIKNTDEFTSTKEAIDITSSDIEVKTLTDASSELGNVEKVEFEENSFSVFVFKADGGIKRENTWDGSERIYKEKFTPISHLFHHAVVANTLEATQHFEGSIRVAEFDLTRSANLDQDLNRVHYNQISEIKVKKTVKNGNGGTFKFGFYNTKDQRIGPLFDVTTENKNDEIKGDITIKNDMNVNGPYSAVFKELYKGEVLYVYEVEKVGDEYRPVKNGDTIDNTYTVTYSYENYLGGEEQGIFNDDDTNYIGKFTTNNIVDLGDNFFGKNDGKYSKTYVGQKVSYDWNDKRVYIGDDRKVYINNAESLPDGLVEHLDNLETTIRNDINAAKDISVDLANAKNFPANEEEEDTSSGAINVINLKSTEGELLPANEEEEDTSSGAINVINLKSTEGELLADLAAANFASPYIKGLLDQDQYLLINISVPDNIETYTISGGAVYFDKVNQEDGKWNAYYAKLASHLILNFLGPVDASSNKPESSYEGEVYVKGDASGLIFAPAATVRQDGLWEGEVIANKAIHKGRELHEKPITSNRTLTVNVTNTGKINESYKLIIKKEWKDQNGNLITDKAITDTFSPINLVVWQLDANGNAVEYKRVNLGPSKKTSEDWTVTLNGVPGDYKYYIQEINGAGGLIGPKDGIEYYSVKNGNKEPKDPTTEFSKVIVTPGRGSDAIVLVCINTRSMNILPSTGGVGDLPYMATGAGAAAAALLGSGLYYKKKKDDDQEEE